MYDLCNSVVMMIIMTNFYQTFVKKIGFFYNLIGAVVLGIIVGCVYSGSKKKWMVKQNKADNFKMYNKVMQWDNLSIFI